MASQLIAGLDIGSTKTCAVISEVTSEPSRHLRLKVVGVGLAKTSGLRREVVTDVDETTSTAKEALKEAELMAGVTVDRVYAGIAGDDVLCQLSQGVVVVEKEEVGPADLERVHGVARTIALPPERELLHAIPLDYNVDDQMGVKDPVGMTATRLETEVYLVTCGFSSAANIRKAVSRAGYTIQELVLEPLASARAVLTEDEKEVGVAMVELGAGTTSAVIYYEGEIRHVAILPLGGFTVTNDLVKGLSIPFAEAQRAKERFGVAVARQVDPKETVQLSGPSPGQKRLIAREILAHVVEQRLDEMFRMIRREIERVGLLERLGAGVVVTGGGVALPKILELGEEVFASPVRLGVPGAGLSGLAEAVASPRFTTAAGLALYGGDRFAETGKGASTKTSGLVSKMGSWIREFF